MAKPRIKMHVEVEGLDELEARLDKLPEAVRLAAERAVGEEVEEIADDMRRGAPRATGELVESIQAEHDGLTGAAVATARHASFVEFGTSDTPEQPFAQPAAETARGRFPARLAGAVGEGLAAR